MPIFEYECTTCETREERILSYDRSKTQRCETCGNPLVKDEVNIVNGHMAVVTGARLWDGTTVKGTFGKSNPRKKRQYNVRGG